MDFGRITISQNAENKAVIRKSESALPDGDLVLTGTISTTCEEDPKTFQFLGNSCNDLVLLTLTHSCDVAPDVSFNLDIGVYDLSLAYGLLPVGSGKLKIVTEINPY